MSLQKRLAYLLVAFAVFALAATFATIYGVQAHVESASASLQRSLDETAWLDRVGLEMREQHVLLREIVDGLRQADELYRARRDGFFSKLDQTAQLVPRDERAPRTAELRNLAAQLGQEFDRCLRLVELGERARARAVLGGNIETQLLPALELRLRNLRDILDASRNRTVDDLVTTNTRVLILAVVTGAFGVGLVIVGTTLVRRWIVLPIRKLQEATQQYRRGNLDFRLALPSHDELGALGQAMNRMAGGLAEARVGLQISEAKHRSLFENLRDAVVICDARERVVEWHDGDAHLLGTTDAAQAGRPLLDIWPHWRTTALDWSALIRRVLTRQTQVRVPDVKLRRDADGEQAADIELIAYPVEFGEARYAALALRDVSEQRQLERQARRAEAMEATVTFARGLAHDFNNLLTSAVASLALIMNEGPGGRLAQRARRALLACRQAAGLSRKLLSFAGGDQGHPQVLCLRETTKLILESLDEDFFDGIRVQISGAGSVPVKIDRDQLTQIILNLIHNAREAMPVSGDLQVTVAAGRSEPTADPDAPPTHAILTVRDSGCGLTPEAKERLFEPFFTTKGRGTRRGRGLGMAVVYAAVKNAGGSIRVEGEPGRGTTIQVYLPLETQVPPSATPPPRAARLDQPSGAILLVDDEPMILQACGDALASWGYSVTTAGSPDAAIREFSAAENGRIALAIVDVNLADGCGLELARELGARDPRLRFIFTSGLADGDVPADLDEARWARLAKPFQLDQLAAAVAAALSPPESPG